jgi:hypothetical protein
MAHNTLPQVFAQMGLLSHTAHTRIAPMPLQMAELSFDPADDHRRPRLAKLVAELRAALEGETWKDRVEGSPPSVKLTSRPLHWRPSESAR